MSEVQVTQSTRDSSVVVRFPGSWLHIARGPRRDLDQILGDEPRAVFVVDGPMFESTAGTDSFLLLDPSKGVNQPTHKPDEGLTISVVNGVASGQYGGRAAPGATVAVQTWPSLVVDGRPVLHETPANVERVWRLGMGVSADGRVVIVMLVGKMSDLSARMVREGIVQGGYLDGGSSLAAEARGVFRRVHTSPSGSRIPGWILAIPPNGSADAAIVPSWTQDGVDQPVPAWAPVVAVAGAVALATAFYWYLGGFEPQEPPPDFRGAWGGR